MNPYQLPFQAELLLKLGDSWGCPSIVLVGHSDGALLALHAAAQAQRFTPPALFRICMDASYCFGNV